MDFLQVVVWSMEMCVTPQLSAVDFGVVLAGKVSLQLFPHPLSQWGFVP